MYHFTFRKTVALRWRKLIGNECIPAAAESIKVLPLAVSEIHILILVAAAAAVVVVVVVAGVPFMEMILQS